MAGNRSRYNAVEGYECKNNIWFCAVCEQFIDTWQKTTGIVSYVG